MLLDNDDKTAIIIYSLTSNPYVSYIHIFSFILSFMLQHTSPKTLDSLHCANVVSVPGLPFCLSAFSKTSISIFLLPVFSLQRHLHL